MKFIFFHFILNFLIGISGFFLTFSAITYLSDKPILNGKSLLNFPFLHLFSFWLVYHAMRHEQERYHQNAFFRRYYMTLLIILIMGTAHFFLSLRESLNSFQFGGYILSILLSALYAWPKSSIRKIPYLKYFLIPFVWTWLGSGMFVADISFFSETQVIEVARFLASRAILVCACMIPFDIHDHENDSIQKIPTLSTLWGKRSATLLMIIFVILAWILLPEGNPLSFYMPGVFLVIAVLGMRRRPWNLLSAELALALHGALLSGSF